MPSVQSLYCPVCSMKETAQPVLAPMVAAHILVAPIDGHEYEKPPYFSYRCQRCGFGEIHKQAVGA